VTHDEAAKIIGKTLRQSNEAQDMPHSGRDFKARRAARNLAAVKSKLRYITARA
jgi:hypothetical protein